MHKAFFLRGKCYYHMGDFQRALFDFSVAIRIEEDNKKKDQGSKKDLAEYYNFAGVQHYELGQLDEAL
jgi:tetratricopeptide (TPR) repeat protein